MDAAVILAVIGSGGVGAIIVSVVNAVQSKKKLGAEATEIITRAAAGVVENLRDDNKDLRETVVRLEAWIDALRDTLQMHAFWDALATKALEDAGITNLPPPPPLYPPQKPNGDGPRITVSETTRP